LNKEKEGKASRQHVSTKEMAINKVGEGETTNCNKRKGGGESRVLSKLFLLKRNELFG